MGNQEIKSTMKMKNTGSFFNLMMGNNNTLPIVGEGATILHWTDRSAYEVISVSKDFKDVVIQRYAPRRLDSYGMSDDQSYEYKDLTSEVRKLRYRNGGWKEEMIRYELLDSINIDDLNEEQRESLIAEHYTMGWNFVEGLTKAKKTYHKVNIIFGVKREYYDFSF